MDDTSTGPVPAATAAAIRQVGLALGAFAIGRGWVQPETVEGIVTLIVTVGLPAWGVYKTWHRQTKIKVAEQMIGGPVPKS